MTNDRFAIWVKISVLDAAIATSISPRRSPTTGKSFNSIEKEYDWVFGYIISNTQADLTILVDDESCSRHDGNTIKIPKNILDSIEKISEPFFVKADVNSMSTDWLNQQHLPPNDLINLTHLNEPSAVHTLRVQYHNDLIYTTAGSILISLNPFKPCPELYNEASMQKYWENGEAIKKNKLELPPHIFSIADHAFRAMMNAIQSKHDQQNYEVDECNEYDLGQSILISGESGSGKTFSTKVVLRYIAALSERSTLNKHKDNVALSGQNGHDNGFSLKNRSKIEQKVIHSNPILQSLGNARTLRNDNSSRFGKFIELQFKENGSLIGAEIETYLLEKVRLVHQQPGERNFHIFYELLDGITDQADRTSIHLNDCTAKDFKLTSMSGTYTRRDEVKDSDLFKHLCNALGIFGFTQSEQQDMFSLMSAIMHASNLNFEVVDDEGSKVDFSNSSIGTVLSLLGVDSKSFNDAICSYEVIVNKEIFSKLYTIQKARKALEALMKAVYHAVFKFVVDRINETMSLNKLEAVKGNERAGYIEVVDIFGFESFETNSFEQLCINYCNEVLQQHFNLTVFLNDQKEYQKEAIDCSFLVYPDNKSILELIDRPTQGIIAVLNDHCKVATGTDSTFVNAVYEQCKDHANFTVSTRQEWSNLFGILHYAGPVEYDAEGFIEKNKDEFPQEGAKLLSSSSQDFVKKIATYIISESTPDGSAYGKKQPNRKTVGSQFIKQLQILRERISTTTPHYVRCFKPNNMLVAGLFDPAVVASQLRCSGVLESLKISRLGYNGRLLHADFVRKYQILGLTKFTNKNESKVETLVRAVRDDFSKKTSETNAQKHVHDGRKHNNEVFEGIQIGLSKVFTKSEVLIYLDHLRGQKVKSSTILIQSWTRKVLSQKIYFLKLRSIFCLQRAARRYAEMKKIRDKMKHDAATVFQKCYRMKLAKRTYSMMLFIKHQIIHGSQKPITQKNKFLNSPKIPTNAVPPVVLRGMRRKARDEKNKAIADLAIGAFYFGLDFFEISRTSKRNAQILRSKSIRFYGQGRELEYPTLARATYVSVSFPGKVANSNNEYTINIPRSTADPYLCPVQAWARVISRVYDVAGNTNSNPINIYCMNNRKQAISINDIRASITSTVTSIGPKSVGFSAQEARKKSFRINPSQRKNMLKFLKFSMSKKDVSKPLPKGMNTNRVLIKRRRQTIS